MKVAGVDWQEKSARAEFLGVRQDATRDVLLFYAKLLSWQGDVESRLNGINEPQCLLPFVPDLMRLLSKSGTPEMRAFASSSGEVNWKAELETFWNERGPGSFSLLTFAALALLQPFAHRLAARSRFDSGNIAPRCPFCLSAPQLGVLRPEGEGGKRYLLCTLCGAEWEYRRVICPNCEESDKEKLPVFQLEDMACVKLFACDTCHTYLKCIDLGVDGHAIPEIDDIATLPMSLWATQNGFSPMKLNLFGF